MKSEETKTIDELLAPLRKEVADKGLTEAEIDNFMNNLLKTAKEEINQRNKIC